MDEPVAAAAAAGEEGSEATRPLSNRRHEAFARLVASGMSHADAYLEAGYDSRHPGELGPRLARRPAVAARIADLIERKLSTVRAASMADAHRIQQELESLAFADLTEGFEAEETDNGIVQRALPLRLWPESLRRALAKVKVRRYVEGHGPKARVVETLEFALHNKTAAIHELRAHMGLLQPKVHEIRGVIALPIIHTPAGPSPGERVLDGIAGDVVAPHIPPPDTGPERRLRELASKLLTKG